MVEYWNDGLAPFGHIFDAFGVKGKKQGCVIIFF